MATYETRLRETRRIEAFDAQGKPQVVIEQSAWLHRVSLRAKPFEPLDGGHRYSLLDGRELLRKDAFGFETADGSVRILARDLLAPTDAAQPDSQKLPPAADPSEPEDGSR